MELPVVTNSSGGSSALPSPIANPQTRGWKSISTIIFLAAAVLIVAVLVWQGLTASGNPDPTTDGLSHTAVVMDTGILVFREGLEAILVLAALTASLVRTEEDYWKPVAIGAGASFVASVATWFIVVALISTINAPALEIQAATGLLAVVVLLVIMNWFFHKVYWTGWITFHNRRKRALIENPGQSRKIIFRGLLLIGFTSVYREGFEIVLFLQTLRLKAGSHVVFEGTLIGLTLTAIVAYLTFALHYRLPYKRMLVLTGIMLGVVLMVMVGESVQEMQQANWLPQHDLSVQFPDWLGTWFAIFNNWETIAAQAFSLIFVVGSYYLARRVCKAQGISAAAPAEKCILPDCEQCELPHAQGADQ
ncbi:MAG TPA: FTR1 family protein [Tepidisphaeraceae bacterium]|jgi:high-affinity iron transporter|nr:FTR1 family protein [Tepidisphaeraceae bacterium]